jgi:hypothetical protein
MKHLLNFPLLVALGASCTGTHASRQIAPQLAQLRTMGYRIAVVPFTNTAPADGLLSDSLAAVGETIALEPGQEAPMRERIAQSMQDHVLTWLQQTDFEVIDPWHAATQWTHAGLASVANDRSRLAEVARALGVDGVLYGDVRQWNRSYYVVQSVAEVGLHVELIDATSGLTLFASDRTERHGAGLSGGPTGYVSAATEPLAGLSGSHLRTLARNAARHLAEDLNGGELGNQPGPTAPRLAVVALAKEHDGPFRAGERVDVVATGTPDCQVQFDLGRLRTSVPMVMTTRHEDPRGPRATYLGHYIVDAVDAATELPLTCTIRRGSARRTIEVHYRWDGTVSLGGDGAP